METQLMGKVEVAARLENNYDITRLQLGEITPDQVRTVDIPAALVDTGASRLCVPRKFIDQLGLIRQQTRTARTTNGEVERGIFGPVRLTIQGRVCSCLVSELPNDCPTLIGQLPLEDMDFVVDPKRQRLIGNPDHGGEEMQEEY